MSTLTGRTSMTDGLALAGGWLLFLLLLGVLAYFLLREQRR